MGDSHTCDMVHACRSRSKDAVKWCQIFVRYIELQVEDKLWLRNKDDSCGECLPAVDKRTVHMDDYTHSTAQLQYVSC